MIKKILSAIVVTIFAFNYSTAQNTIIPSGSVNTAGDVANWTIFPTNVTKQWFNGNCIAIYIDNLPNLQIAYLSSPIFNVPTTGAYELELRYGLVYATTPIIFELVSDPANTVVSTSPFSTIAGTCTSWPNSKISKLNFSNLASGNYRLRATIPKQSQFFLEGLRSNINYTMNTEKFSSHSYFNVFPNPNNGNFEIEINDASVKIATIKIFDLQGKLFVSKENISNNRYVQTTDFENGLYVLEISTENDTKYYQKIIVQN